MLLLDSLATIEHDGDAGDDEQDGGQQEAVVKDGEQSPEQTDIPEVSCCLVCCHSFIGARKQFMCYTSSS